MSIPFDKILTIKMDKRFVQGQCYNQFNVDSHFTHKKTQVSALSPGVREM